MEKRIYLQWQTMSKQIEAERDVTSRSFDAASESTEHFISWVGILGGIGSLLGGIFVFLSWPTSRKDYQHEREFYEHRMKSMDNIKDVEAFQQQHLGNPILARSDEMLSKQIESISKLGGVIVAAVCPARSRVVVGSWPQTRSGTIAFGRVTRHSETDIGHGVRPN